jgi:hypothetical protein
MADKRTTKHGCQVAKSRTSFRLAAAFATLALAGCLIEDGEESGVDLSDIDSVESYLAANLTANRDRLIDTYAARLGTNRCAAWNGMTTSQKGVFLTISDLLGKRSWLYNDYYTYSLFWDECPGYNYGTDCTGGCYIPSSYYYGYCDYVDGYSCYTSGYCDQYLAPRTGAYLETALDHVTKIWAINGAGSGCGGGDDNRMYLSMNDTLTSVMRNFYWGLPGWDDSSDLKGAHAPFTNSSETLHGQPRGQAHFWRWNSEATVLSRPGVYGVYDPQIVEIDIDYNFWHNSNPECYYGGVYGRTKYQNMWWGQGKGGSAEYSYRPGGC